MFVGQKWRSECIEGALREMQIEIPKDIADAIACLERDALHRLIGLLNLAVWDGYYEERGIFSAPIAWSKVNSFLQSQQPKLWLGLLKVLVGLL